MTRLYNTLEIVPATALESVFPLLGVLEDSVIDSFDSKPDYKDIVQILQNVEATRLGEGSIEYAIARESGTILGMMGLRAVGIAEEDDMRKFATQECAAELVNAYVIRRDRRIRTGTILFEHLVQRAEEQGFTELLVNSGPRYEKTGWPFWTFCMGEPVAMMKDKYGAGRHAPVWRMEL